MIGAYVVVLLVASGVGYVLVRTTVATASARAESKHEKTVLDERIATAREIRAILSKPQPPIEPLPPITAKVANLHPTKVVGMDSKHRPIRLPNEASDAFAMDSQSYSSGRYGGYDPGRTGGW